MTHQDRELAFEINQNLRAEAGSMKTEGAHAPECLETRHPRLSGCCVYVVNMRVNFVNAHREA
jgi:hypothetical protein